MRGEEDCLMLLKLQSRIGCTEGRRGEEGGDRKGEEGGDRRDRQNIERGGVDIERGGGWYKT